MKKFYKRFAGKTAILLVVVMTVFCLAGCSSSGGSQDNTNSGNGGSLTQQAQATQPAQNDGGGQKKDLIDDLIDALVDEGDNGGSGDDFLGSLFDAFLGGSSADYGWGESNYSGGYDNYIGTDQNKFEYADISNVPAGQGSATIMFYCIGSNLESDDGSATMDLQEMVEANVGKNVNIIVEAGGAKKWQNSVMEAGKTGRFKIEGEYVYTLETPVSKSMVEPSEVVDFINFSVKNFPADRYGFIFWDHGGGTLAGFGMDDNFEGDLQLDEIASAFRTSGVHFDFIGFDACLMGTLEMAYGLKDSADYMLASEETEPGTGWYYTSWLKALDKNPSLDMETLGRIIIDDFVAANSSHNVTLSLVDLSKIQDVYLKVAQVCANGDEALYSGGYNTLSMARKKTKNFGEGEYDQIDIIDFCNKCGLDGADELIDEVNAAVKYHKTNIKDTNGLAMYFPFDYPSYYTEMLQMMKSFGMNDPQYATFFNDFLSGKSSGHRSKSLKPIEAKTGYTEEVEEEDYTQEEWYNDNAAGAGTIINFPVDEDGFIEVTELDNGYILEMDEDHWGAIVKADIGMFIDYGEGFVDYGLDDNVRLDEDGNIILDVENAWVAINGQIVPFTTVGAEDNGEDDWYSYGVVPALYTSARTGEEKLIDILVYWDSEHDGGYVKGFRTASEDGPTQAERNVTSFVKGDKIILICDYFTYDGEYEDTYALGDEIVITEPLKVTYEDITEGEQLLLYVHLEDIYGNDYYSDFIPMEIGSEEE